MKNQIFRILFLTFVIINSLALISSSITKGNVSGEIKTNYRPLENITGWINISFDKDYFKILSPGMRENVSLIIQTGTSELGLYEITINASSLSPKYADWGKIYVSVEEGTTITEKLLFTEEFVVENPECIELKERVDESRRFLDSGDFKAAEKILDEAVNSCKKAISQKSLFSGNRIKVKFQDKIFIYLLIATIAAILFGISYYVYQIIVFRRAVARSAKENANFSGVMFKTPKFVFGFY